MGDILASFLEELGHTFPPNLRVLLQDRYIRETVFLQQVAHVDT